MSDLELTVAVPTYMRDINVLGPTLETIVNQKVKPDRIIVIDQTPESGLRGEIRKRFPEVEYFFNGTPGLCRARNRALEECDTDIILFCDDDVRVSDA